MISCSDGVVQTSIMDFDSSGEKRIFTQLDDPSYDDLLLAICKFNDIAHHSNIDYAIVGGFSARIFGGHRTTKSLDILIAPQHCINGQNRMTQIIDELFENNPNVLEYIRPNHEGHIIVTHRNVGVPTNFIDCGNTVYHFPDLIAETRPDGTSWSHNDPEPTWTYRHIQSDEMPAGFNIPVLLPRLLLQQRVLHFIRSQEKDDLDRKKNDINDIAVYLTYLYGSEHQSFTDEEAQELLPHVRDILRFADSNSMDGLELSKWRWINIPLKEGDWRE